MPETPDAPQVLPDVAMPHGPEILEPGVPSVPLGPPEPKAPSPPPLPDPARIEPQPVPGKRE